MLYKLITDYVSSLVSKVNPTGMCMIDCSLLRHTVYIICGYRAGGKRERVMGCTEGIQVMVTIYQVKIKTIKHSTN